MARSVDITFSSLDPSQKNAFRLIDNDSSSLHIVHGPPGTGKSQLVVSLLERLASKNKKVLFVSQNTEALKVIERMIERTEKAIGWPTDKKYISLLDFCLMLYNPTHRHLKYLREQYTRISGKQLPTINTQDAPDEIKYILKYTNLNHELNYNVAGENIGFDELVGYYLRYVNQNMAPEPLRAFINVNVRVVFDTLDHYTHKEYFAEFNKPRRELVLLSTKNPNLSLPEVRSNLQTIRESLTTDWTTHFAAKQPIDIIDYLALLKEYSSAVQLLDVYKVATENKDIAELTNTLKDFVTANDGMHSQISAAATRIAALSSTLTHTAVGISHDTFKIRLSPTVLTLADNSFDEVMTDYRRTIELTKQIITTYPDVVHIGIQDIWIGLAKAVADIYHTTIHDTEGALQPLTAADIDRLNEDLRTYDAQNSMKRMIGGIPTSFKEHLRFTNAKELDNFRNGAQEVLSVIRDTLVLKNTTIGSLLEIANHQAKAPLSKLGIKAPTTIQEAVTAFQPVYELVGLLSKYEIAIGNFAETRQQLQTLDGSLTTLRSAINNPSNKQLYLSGSLESFVATVNTSIDIRTEEHQHQELIEEQRDLQAESFRQNAQYLVGITEASKYAATAQTVYDYLNHKIKGLNELFTGIALPDDNRPISSDIEAISAVMNNANLSDNFSDYFFEMSKGQTLADWLSSVSPLETYNNDAEVVDFIEHNNSINTIRVAMGIDNKKYLDEILANDINFDIFAARIVNAIVGECFGRAPIADKKHITTKDIVDAYDEYLKNQKTGMYYENLRYLYDQTLESVKELSKQSTLQMGGKSTMDKFRHNTHTIATAFPIICATPKDVSKYIAADKGLFDYVIFDEASQLLPGQAIPSMYRAKKAVIIGDPHQMPPGLNASFSLVEQSDDEFEDLGESILDLVLKQPQKQHHLKVHYRSKYNKLFEPSREAIYSNDGIEPIFEAELAQGAPIDIIDDLGESVDEFGYDKNFYKICESIDEALAQNNKADFCILFTRGDVLGKFKDFLADVGERKFSSVAKLYDTDKILISTVTNCQGIEGAYTIIYLHHYSTPGAMWFFKEAAGAYKRLNVSITRQREGLKLLLADQRSHWIKACDDKLNRNDIGPNTRRSAELMRTLLTSAGEQADATYLDRKLGQNTSWFDSPLTEQLYDKLTEYYTDKLGHEVKIYSEVGWNLLIPTGEGIDANERNVGFRIDLGIYSVKQRKFVLGIEMDGAMYHSGFDKEHSDYNRQKVLEDKGWELYRIWSTNWLNDNEREFTKLTQKIDSKL